MGVRGSLYPAVKDLQPGWWDDPKQAREVVALFNKVVLNGDSAANLAATGLVTNAYLYTGDDKYKQWVVDYVEAWMDRIEQNGGIIPDNVGPTGKPGEHRDGVWWGTLYGWNSYVGWSHIFHSLGVASECAHLVTQDDSYLEILRSQINVLLDNSITDDNGQLLVPNRATPNGWVHAHVEEDKWDATSSTNLRLYELAHLYHASMSQDDYDLILRVREGDHLRDWNEEALGAARAEHDSEYSRFQYYDGKNPTGRKRPSPSSTRWRWRTTTRWRTTIVRSLKFSATTRSRETPSSPRYSRTSCSARPSTSTTAACSARPFATSTPSA